MKELFPGLYGSRALKERLGASLLREPPAISHAYVIEGPSGIGKHTLALQLSAALCCRSRGRDGVPLPCGECESCRKILSGGSPDVITVGDPDAASLGVDVIRDLKRDVHVRPNDLDYKIYVLNNAHTMTVQAQNAFLLTLEEPPEYAVFLLLCESARDLLETVRSRAPVLRLCPLTPEEEERALTEKVPAARIMKNNDPRRFAGIVMASGGRLGRAAELLGSGEGKRLSEQRAAAHRFCTLCADVRRGSEALTRLVSDCGSARDKTAEVLEQICLCLRDLIVLKKAPDAPLRFYSDREQAAALCDAWSLRRLLTAADAAEKARRAVDRNMNVRLTLVSLIRDVGML